MTVVADRPMTPWLQRETPLGVPAFTPIRVDHLSENCYFQLDGLIVRMVFLGGLSGNDDPSAVAWTLRATPQIALRGVELCTGWRNGSRKTILTPTTQKTDESDFASHRQALIEIESITGYSRRELEKWLGASHTTLNGIATSARVPRSALAGRITNFHRLARRLQSLYGEDRESIHRALTTAADGKSAFDYVLENDYQQAATAAQRALRPSRRLKPIRGQKFHDAEMVAVESL
jgi:hypothetical protein